MAVRRPGDRAHRHRGRALPQRRDPLPEPVPAGHAPGQGAPLGDPRGDGAGEDGAVLPRPLRAQLLDPGRGRGRELHRREGAAPGAQPADLHLDRRRRPLPLEHPPSGLGAADHRGGPVGVRVARDRHDLPGGGPAVQGRARTSTRPRPSTSTATSVPRATRSASTRSNRRTSVHVARRARHHERRHVGPEQPRHDQQRAVVGPERDPRHVLDPAEPADLLPDRRRRRRPLPRRRQDPRQVLIAARGLNSADLPSQSFVNRHIVYTHGYGVVASPSNQADSDGNPSFLLKDIPTKGLGHHARQRSAVADLLRREPQQLRAHRRRAVPSSTTSARAPPTSSRATRARTASSCRTSCAAPRSRCASAASTR